MALEFDTIAADVETSQPKKSGPGIRLTLFERGPGATDRMFFTEQLALLLETGESLLESLNTIVTQTENARMRHIIERVAADITEGKTFAYALAQHEAVFSSTYVSLVAASEQGGFMHDVLRQLLTMDKKREELRTTLVSAATYPAFLITFSFAVVVFVLVVVFPKFGSMFTSIYDQLPASTRVLMSISEIMRAYWIYLAAGSVGLVVVARQWLQSDNGRQTVDRWKLTVPGMRGLFAQIYLVQAFQVLSLSLTNGVSVMESLESCREVVRNSLFRKLILDTEEKVQAGQGVAAGFAEAGFLPELARHMISTGEQTGKLGLVLGRIAEYYEGQLTRKLTALSKLAEPIMLLVMGVIVGVLVSSLILPIFKLSRAVS